jgi:hypothetical protein
VDKKGEEGKDEKELEEVWEQERRTRPVNRMENAKRFFMVCSYSKSIFSIKRNERFSFFSLCEEKKKVRPFINQKKKVA